MAYTINLVPVERTGCEKDTFCAVSVLENVVDLMDNETFRTANGAALLE